MITRLTKITIVGPTVEKETPLETVTDIGEGQVAAVRDAGGGMTAVKEDTGRKITKGGRRGGDIEGGLIHLVTRLHRVGPHLVLHQKIGVQVDITGEAAEIITEDGVDHLREMPTSTLISRKRSKRV